MKQIKKGMRGQEFEDKVLLGFMQDKIKGAQKNDPVQSSKFLDIRQGALVQQSFQKEKGNLLLMGGYENAERCVALFSERSEEEIAEYFSETITAVRVSVKGKKSPLHRDYLGSLLSLGIERDTIGDILVGDRQADIILLRKIVSFVCSEFKQVGGEPVEVLEIDLAELKMLKETYERICQTVAAPRLDAILALGMGLPRNEAKKVILAGKVFVNGLLQYKPEYVVKEQDKIVLRGNGKMILEEIGGQSRKGRLYITIKKLT